MLAGWLLVSASGSMAAGAGEAILIRADRAWEERLGDETVLSLAGSFAMSGDRWSIEADSASVFGDVENPERIEIQGSPARASFTDDRGRVAKAEGRQIVYRYQQELVEIHGDAKLNNEDLSIVSSRIVYDLGQQRLQSSGEDGIEFVLQRKPNSE